MNDLKKNDPEKDELLELALYNDVLDIFLFGIGLFLPFGDYFESIVGGAFDILLLIWMFEVIRRNAIWIFVLECIDLADLFTVGKFDVVGWIEVLPFWYFYYKDLTVELKFSEKKLEILDDSNLSSLSAAEKSLRPTIEMETQCPGCGNKVPIELLVCELCGTKIKKRK